MKTPTILKNDFGIIIFCKEEEDNEFVYGSGRLYTHHGLVEEVNDLTKSSDNDLLHNGEKYKEIVLTEEISHLYLELLKANAVQKVLINQFLD